MIPTVYILTHEINEYDQDGEYFDAVYKQKPTHEQLRKAGVKAQITQHVLKGGGRITDECIWWHLREEVAL